MFIHPLTSIIPGPLAVQTNKLAVEMLKRTQSRAFNELLAKHRRPRPTRGGNVRILVADLTKLVVSSVPSPRHRPESSELGSGPIVEEVPPVRFPLYPPGSWTVAHWNLMVGACSWTTRIKPNFLTIKSNKALDNGVHTRRYVWYSLHSRWSRGSSSPS